MINKCIKDKYYAKCPDHSYIIMIQNHPEKLNNICIWKEPFSFINNIPSVKQIYTIIPLELKYPRKEPFSSINIILSVKQNYTIILIELKYPYLKYAWAKK